jgi:hypothetical protein
MIWFNLTAMSTAGGNMSLKELSPERAIYYWKISFLRLAKYLMTNTFHENIQLLQS